MSNDAVESAASPRRIRGAGATDAGRRRERNEDSLDWWVAPDGAVAVAVVADGVGGQPGGDQASALAVDAAMAALASRGNEPDAAADLQRAFAAADAALHHGRTANEALANMATTLVAAVLDTTTVALAHVGDSRAYWYARGRLEQITRDHTVAQQMVDDGVLKPDQRDRVPFANVLSRAMDGGGRTPEITWVHWAPGDRLLLCSDGLNAALEGESIMAALEAADPSAAVYRLIEAANQAGAPDNITVIVLELL